MEPPRIAEACTIDRHGFAEKSLSLYSHVGTHIDVPGQNWPWELGTVLDFVTLF